MRVSMGGLTVWSFLMATAHGAGLMVVPVFMGMSMSGAGEHAHHMPAAGAGAGAAFFATGLHAVGYLAVTAFVAVLVFEKLGVGILRRAWFNLDLIYLAAHATGTQGYVCVAVGSVYSWATFGPLATLFNEDGEQILTHFLSPTPVQPAAQPDVAALTRLERRLGPGDQILVGSELRGTRCDSLAAARSRCRRGRPHRWRQADGGRGCHSAA